MLRQKLAIAVLAGIVSVGWASVTAFADDGPAKPTWPEGPRPAAAGTVPHADLDGPEGPPPDGLPPGPPPDGHRDRGPGGRSGPPGPPPDGGPGPGPEGRNGPPGPPPDDAPGHRPGKAESAPPSPPVRWPYGDLEAMQTRDPEMYKLMKADAELDRQSRDLAGQYRQASPEKRDQIRRQVEQVVNQHFEVRQERRLLELKRLKEELQSLQEAIDRRTKVRKELVEKRISDLLGSEEHPKF